MRVAPRWRVFPSGTREGASCSFFVETRRARRSSHFQEVSSPYGTGGVAGTDGRSGAGRSLARPLKELDDALAADRLEHAAIVTATQQLAFIRLELGRLEASVVAERGI